jgi:predicted metal-dependent HD superfamily phosphohydrolase
MSDFDDLLSHVPIDDAAKARLTGKMTESTRRYHGVNHLTLLWQRHRIYGAHTVLAVPALTALVACAIAYHDSIYDGHRTDNEERSAEFWMDESRDSAIGDDDRQWVADTIRATSDHLSYEPSYDGADWSAGSGRELRERARLWLLDLDLTPLGEPPGEFERNSRLLREEAPDFTEEQWRAATRRFLRRINDAPLIFRSPALAAIYEKPARLNLGRELARLQT